MPKEDKNNGDRAFDLAKAKEEFLQEKALVANARKEFEGLRDKLEADFEKELPSLLSDEEKDILDLDGDPVKQWQILNAKHKDYVDAKVEAARAELERAEDELEEKEKALAVHEAQEQFKNSNKELDFDAMVDWFENDLPNREKQKLIEESGNDHIKFLEIIKEAFEVANGKKGSKEKKEEEPKLPKDINSVAGTSGDLNMGSDNEETNYFDGR